MTQPRTINDLIAKNAIAYVAIGSLLVFAGIDAVIFVTHPAPPPQTVWNQQFLAAAVILVISLPLVMILKKRGY